MPYAYEVREKFEGLLSKITEIAGQVMLEHKEEIIPLIILQQYDEHIDSAGNPLRPYSTPYRKHKELSGKSGQTDFDETGEFHAEMNLSVNESEYTFNSPARTDKGELKSDWLNEWNGSETMELTPENEAKIYPIIQDDFVTRLSEVVGLD